MDNFRRSLSDASALSSMLSSSKGKMHMYDMMDRPSPLCSETRYSLSGRSYSGPDTKNFSRDTRDMWRAGTSWQQNRDIPNTLMSRNHEVINTELPFSSRNYSREGYPFSHETGNCRDDISGYRKDLDAARMFTASNSMQAASRLLKSENYVNRDEDLYAARQILARLQASENSSAHKESGHYSGVGSLQGRDGQRREMHLGSLCSNPSTKNEGLLAVLQIINAQGRGPLLGSNAQSQPSSSRMGESRESLLEQLKLVQLLKTVQIPASPQLTKESLPEDDVLSFWGNVSQQLHKDQSKFKIGKNEMKPSSDISDRESRKTYIESYVHKDGMDQLPSWREVSSRKEKPDVPSNPPRSGGSQRKIRSRSPQRLRNSSPRYKKLDRRSPIRNRSRSPRRPLSRSPRPFRSRSPMRYRSSRSPKQYRSQSPKQSLSRGRSPRSYRSRSPAVYRSHSPRRYRSRSPVVSRNPPPGRYRSRSPAVFRSPSPERYRSRSPAIYKSHSSGRYRSRSPASHKGISPSHGDWTSVSMNHLDTTSPYKLIGALRLIESAVRKASTPYILQVTHADVTVDVFSMPQSFGIAMLHDGFELRLEVVPGARAEGWRSPLYRLLDFAFESNFDMDVYVEARAHDDEMDIRNAKAFELAEYFHGSNVVIAIVPLEVWESRLNERGKKKKKKKGNSTHNETVFVQSQDIAPPRIERGLQSQPRAGGIHSRLGPKSLRNRLGELAHLEDELGRKSAKSRLGVKSSEDIVDLDSDSDDRHVRKNVLDRLGERVDVDVPVIELD